MQVVEVGADEVALGVAGHGADGSSRAQTAAAAASVASMPGELLQVDVGDLTFDVRADGPEDGRPVLLLHGFPETSLSLGGGDAAARRGRAAHLRARPARLLPRRPARRGGGLLDCRTSPR